MDPGLSCYKRFGEVEVVENHIKQMVPVEGSVLNHSNHVEDLDQDTVELRSKWAIQNVL
jgi:hypothetical protein